MVTTLLLITLLTLLHAFTLKWFDDLRLLFARRVGAYAHE